MAGIKLTAEQEDRLDRIAKFDREAKVVGVNERGEPVVRWGDGSYTAVRPNGTTAQ